MVQAGHDRAAQGFSVFPLGPNKKPLKLCAVCSDRARCSGRGGCVCDVDTCHSFYAATNCHAKISRWWTQNPQWQMGLRTGQASGLVVLDVDVDKGGLDSLIALQRRGLDITGAGCQLSGSGRSFHLFFRCPGIVIPNSQGALGPGLDVRGDGGYVVIAPSLHPATGQPYEILGDLLNLPVWPTQLTPVVRLIGNISDGAPSVSSIAVGGRRVTSWVRVVASAPMGRRRAMLFWAGCRLAEIPASKRAKRRAADALLAAAEESGLPRDEALSTLRDGLLTGRRA